MENGSQVILPNSRRKPHKGEDGMETARVLAGEGDAAGELGHMFSNKVEGRTLKACVRLRI